MISLCSKRRGCLTYRTLKWPLTLAYRAVSGAERSMSPWQTSLTSGLPNLRLLPTRFSSGILLISMAPELDSFDLCNFPPSLCLNPFQSSYDSGKVQWTNTNPPIRPFPKFPLRSASSLKPFTGFRIRPRHTTST